MTPKDRYTIYLRGWRAMKYPPTEAKELAARSTCSDIWHAEPGNPPECDDPRKGCPCEDNWKNYEQAAPDKTD